MMHAKQVLFIIRLINVNESYYKNIKTIHNAAAEVLKRVDLLWENTVEKH